MVVVMPNKIGLGTEMQNGTGLLKSNGMVGNWHVISKAGV